MAHVVNYEIVEPDTPTDLRCSPEIAGVLRRVASLLPAQGPITSFVHHNPLHVFEHRDFERAVDDAASLFACEPFLPEHEYRDALLRRRIRPSDIEAVLAQELGEESVLPVANLPTTRHALALAILCHGIPFATEAELAWLASESDALARFRGDAHPRHVTGGVAGSSASTLWDACLRVASLLSPQREASPTPPIRHGDLVRQAVGTDADVWVESVLIAFCAAFLDQGVAYWPMPERDLGVRGCFLQLYGGTWSWCERLLADARWRRLHTILEGERERSDEESIAYSLELMGVPTSEHEPFLMATALRLRGWAGMMHQMGVRPDRAPGDAPAASLAGLLAVRLLLERAALAVVCGSVSALSGRLSSLRERARRMIQPQRVASAIAVAWPVFHAAQLLGWTASELDVLDVRGARDVFTQVNRFMELEGRRLLHLAYERRYAQDLLDALVLHRTGPVADRPTTFQAVFCIDEREESIRRHLEEAAPTCETFGAAGYFGVAMSYRGIDDAHGRPLCPVTVRPGHAVSEVSRDVADDLALLRARSRRALGGLRRGIDVGSRTFVRGTVVSTLVGALAAIPLVSRVLFPRFTARMRERSARLVKPARRTRLSLPFSIDEMATIVERQLTDIGLVANLASLVFVIGHGSHSLNNPHESAHDCGACGGAHGGPNARAFARMANDTRVRAELRSRGLTIPETTFFVGAEHDTCDDAIVFFDLDAVPKGHRVALETARSAFEAARSNNAHERCRRFEGVAPRISPRQALAHVEARAQDLAQPRPEYGHATNAACIVGRRHRSRGLFLDRRVFLVSYDPTADDEAASVLARVLEAVVPVVAGINLEYWFGRVDPIGYGCGTKLPHNVTAMLGVMDGHASDLRTGLPWQMVEIHEPVRLLMVVEASCEAIDRVLQRLPAVARLVENRWIRLAALSPSSPDVFQREHGEWRRHRRELETLPVVAESRRWYGGSSQPLPPARIDPADLRVLR